MEVKLKNITYKYKNAKKNILSNVSMDIEEGKIIGITGECGSGKTTLLEIINALRTPTEGTVEIGEFIISNENEKLDISKLHFKVGMLYQSPDEQFLSLTVKEVLELPLRFYGYNKTKITSRIEDVLNMVGLNYECLFRNPNSLSNGEKRKLQLALVLLLNPEVLLLDEPVIGLDVEEIKQFLKLIRLLKNRYKKTIIIASNNTELLHKVVDYIYVLHNGKIVLEGNKYDVFKEEALLKKWGVKVPNTIAFSNSVLKSKNIKIGYRDEINDLLKDIYRYVK